MTFVVLGYAPIHRAKKGLLVSFLILSIITIPLVASFMKVMEQNTILNQLNNKQYKIYNKIVEVNILEVDLSKDLPNIFIETKSKDHLNKEDLQLLNQKISSQVGTKILLNIDMRIIVNGE